MGEVDHEINNKIITAPIEHFSRRVQAQTAHMNKRPRGSVIYGRSPQLVNRNPRPKATEAIKIVIAFIYGCVDGKRSPTMRLQLPRS